MIEKFIRNPVTLKRWRRFKEVRRAYLSLWVLAILYGLSLFSEFICNDVPIFVRFNGRVYFPVVQFQPEDTFLKNGRNTRPDYKRLQRMPVFAENPDNYMVFPPLPFGPYESVDPDSIQVSENVTVKVAPQPLIGMVDITPAWRIRRTMSMDGILGGDPPEVSGRDLGEYFDLPGGIRKGMELRFENRAAPRVTETVRLKDGRRFDVSLSTFSPRASPPVTVRLIFREVVEGAPRAGHDGFEYLFAQGPVLLRQTLTDAAEAFWMRMPEAHRRAVLELVKSRFFGPVDSYRFAFDGRRYKVEVAKDDVQFPYPPVAGHPMGIDGAGRDVAARVLYGLRTSLSFGLLLVACSMAIGITAGAIQGFYGGLLDISAQRLIEIWSALPFLYVMILMGSVYGRSFSLLLFCYGIFNWIGISYYIRAEFLRLRKKPFVEAARCMGGSSIRIIFRHILPNSLVPVITFFPFSLVGAIGALAALDYLGFGLPPPTPSWGELLYQAQQYRWAWWLILYPSLALFGVMLFSVFVGEGFRNAYDPRRHSILT